MRSHVAALDGLRGIAILSVMAFHYSPPVFGTRAFLYGYLGVDLFFVLSGFLISGILLDSLESPRYFRTFYARRVLRIFPAYYAFLAVMFLLPHLIGFKTHPHNYLLYAAYIQNWPLDAGKVPYDAYLGHLWSLAVEEQFYLFWPLLIWLCPKRVFPWFCGALAVGTLVSRVLCAPFLDLNTIWKFTPFRLDSLCIGALLAFLVRREQGLRWLRITVVPLAIFAAAWFAVVQLPASFVAPSSYSAAALFFGAAVFWAADARPQFLQLKFLTTIGKYSYAMYLFHLPPHILLSAPITHWAERQGPAVWTATRFLYMPVLAAAVFGAAYLSWHVLERPFLRLKRYFTYETTNHKEKAAIPF